MTAATLWLAAALFAAIVVAVCLVVLVVERRQQRYLRQFHRAAEETQEAIGQGLAPALEEAARSIETIANGFRGE